MSSPLGGFYIGAHKRYKTEQYEAKNRIYLDAELTLFDQQICVFDETIALVNEHLSEFENEQVNISVSPKISPSQLIGLTFVVKGEGFQAEQLLNVEPGESISTLIGGHEKLKLTVVCRIK